MQKTNDVTLTGVFTLTQITATFEKQSLVFASKDREGAWKNGDFEIYCKPDLLQQSGLASGDEAKLKGFMVFSFFTKADGTQMSFPKLIVTEVMEVEKAGAVAGAQPQMAQPTQPQAMMQPGVPTQPPVPGAAPMAPPQPQAVPQPMPQAADAFPPVMPQAAPMMPPAPPQPAA